MGERNMAIKKALDGSNFTGLSMANAEVPDAQKVIWSDLVKGKPDLEEERSKSATDLDHPCRIPGSEYLRCVQDNYKEKAKNRQMKCASLFSTFDACRKGILQQQATSLENSMIK